MSEQLNYFEMAQDEELNMESRFLYSTFAQLQRLDKQNELLGRIAYAVEWRGIKKEQYKELYIKWEGAEPNSDDEIEMVHKMADLVLRECAR